MLNRILAVVLITLFSFNLMACSSKSGQKHMKDMSMPSEAQMAKMMKEAGQPSLKHQALSPLAGSWIAKSKWRMSPEQPMEESQAISKKAWVLNGLFLQEQHDDSNTKHPFKGVGMIGYDKIANNYTSTWFDTMSSATWQSTGEMAKPNIIQFNGGGSCPMTGEYKEVDSELHIISKNKHVLRMYDRDPEGNRFLNLEIEYTRS